MNAQSSDHRAQGKKVKKARGKVGEYEKGEISL
jgi:hypothetical protein